MVASVGESNEVLEEVAGRFCRQDSHSIEGHSYCQNQDSESHDWARSERFNSPIVESKHRRVAQSVTRGPGCLFAFFEVVVGGKADILRYRDTKTA